MEIIRNVDGRYHIRRKNPDYQTGCEYTPEYQYWYDGYGWRDYSWTTYRFLWTAKRGYNRAKWWMIEQAERAAYIDRVVWP